MKKDHHKTSRAMTLIEVMVTVVVVAFVGMGIMASVVYGTQAQRKVQEYNSAARIAAGELDELKRRSFYTLTKPATETVTIFDNGTPGDASDDVTGTVEVSLFDSKGTEVGTGGVVVPTDRSMIRAEATVTWTPAGNGETPEVVVMESLLAP